MQYHSLVAYIFVALFGLSFVMVQANKEREQFTDLLQKRKHLNGYWVGKRYIVASDEDLNESGKRTDERTDGHDAFTSPRSRRRSLGRQASVVLSRQTRYLSGRQASLVPRWTQTS